MITLGSVVTNKVRNDIDFGVVMDTRKHTDNFGFIKYDFEVRFKLLGKNHFENEWWSSNVTEIHKTINEKNICEHCNWLQKYGISYGVPECLHYCHLTPGEDADEPDVPEEPDEPEDYKTNENKNLVPYIDKNYNISSLEEYKKCQELALRARRVILQKFKKLKSLNTESSVRIIKRDVYILKRNRFDIYGEIDRTYLKQTGEFYDARIAIHCALKGKGHFPFDPLDGIKTKNLNETEYRIDGPKVKLETLNILI